jgi:hypothetical protein
VFIYVYYELFACTNLVTVMPLFFTVFLFHLSIFRKNHRFIGETCRISSIPDFYCSSIVSGAFRPNFPEFSKNRQNRSGPVFLLPSNF